MIKAYLVVGRFYTYTDEYMMLADRDEADIHCVSATADPRRIFTDKAEAEQFAERIHREMFDGWKPGEFALEASHVSSLSDEAINSGLHTLFGDRLTPAWELPVGMKMDWSLSKLPPSLSDEERGAVSTLFDRIRFADVVEIEEDETTLFPELDTTTVFAEFNAALEHQEATYRGRFYPPEEAEVLARDKAMVEKFGLYYLMPDERY